MSKPKQWRQGRELKHYDAHYSDCAVYNEPAYPNGPCDCGFELYPQEAEQPDRLWVGSGDAGEPPCN